jgi:hypothetical protein
LLPGAELSRMGGMCVVSGLSRSALSRRRRGARVIPAAVSGHPRVTAGWGQAVAALVLSFALACVAAAGPAAAGPDQKIRIAFAGDSLVDNYWSGVTRIVAADACLKDVVELGRFARNGTGLTRGDRVYWPRQVRHIGDTFKPALFVLSIGLNDRQFIADANGARTAWGAPNWADKYRQEVAEFLKGAAASHAPVLWLGLPAMRERVDNEDAIEKNGMFAEAVAQSSAANVHYVEPWRLRAAGAETFSSFGPGKNGRMVQIRTSDGQHFTTAGEDLIAAYLFPRIIAALSAVDVRIAQCANGKEAEQH